MTEILAPAIDYAKRVSLNRTYCLVHDRSIPFYESKGFPNINDTYKSQNGGKLPKKVKYIKITI